jgi:NADH-quinone oxidoreductase subunit M
MTALFFAAIGMIYDRTHTRQVKELGGLLKNMPVISTVFILAGLCSLGLPGMSGFVAEMTIFTGAWENTSAWVRLATILSCASIVVTAVYILRAAGKAVMGPVVSAWQELKDAAWQEKAAAGILLVGIFMMGLAPFLVQYLTGDEAAVLVRSVSGNLTNK